MAELLPPDAVDRFRKPDVVATEGYLNDPITFDADPRFQPESLIEQLGGDASGSIPQYKTDQADFKVVNLNGENTEYLSTSMVHDVYDRFRVERFIDRTFEQFTTASFQSTIPLIERLREQTFQWYYAQYLNPPTPDSFPQDFLDG